MAISLEELALGALEGSAGPWTLAVGAGALAVALAAGSARPVRRMASTGAFSGARTGAFGAQRTGQLNLTGWIGSARQSWLDLVAEARAEYEASRHTPTRAEAAAAPLVLREADRAVPGAMVDAPAAPVTDTAVTSPEPAVTSQPGPSKRDQRGRFVRHATNNNGTRSE